MPSAPRYNVMNFFGQDPEGHYASSSPHALMVIYPLAQEVSYNRDEEGSFETNPSNGVELRGPPLFIADDLVGISIERSKSQHVKHAAITLQGGALLREVLPGDWCAIWLMPDRATFDDVLSRARKGEACNRATDGLRLVGTVNQIRKQFNMQGSQRIVKFILQAVGFTPFDAQIFYDMSVATYDVMQHSVGGYLTRVGIDAEAWFTRHVPNDNTDNINTIMPEVLNLVLGRGASQELNPGASLGLAGAAGGGLSGNRPSGGEEKDMQEMEDADQAKSAYVVPPQIGRLLGIKPQGNVLSYAQLLNPLIGLQVYAPTKDDDLDAFVPLRQNLKGSFLPKFPELVNTPFWEVLRQFLNPSINEMYTTIRMNEGGTVAMTFVVRQIPLTTDKFKPRNDRALNFTRFLSLPRWVIPSTLIISSDLGRSDATRCNLVHVYGAASQLAGANSATKQMVENPPIRDDLDIQRSGPRVLMQTVECGANAEDVNTSQSGRWMKLVADWTLGSHLTLNGVIQTIGIPGPIAEGDNVEIDGAVFHIESIGDEYHMQGANRTWRSTLHLCNGVLAQSNDKFGLHYFGIDDGNNISIDKSDPGESTIRRND